jgi:hypothetical protein
VLNGIYRNPCHPATDPTPVAPGVDGVLAALSSVQGFAVSDVQDVTVGGLHGKRFLFGNDIDTAAAGCAANPMPFGTSDQDGDGAVVDIPMFGGETDRFWALDAGDVTIVAAITDEPAIFADAQPVLETIIFGDGSGG